MTYKIIKNDTAVFSGNVKDYNIVLDGTTYIITRKSDNFVYNLPNIENLRFDDRTITYADFPSNGDSYAELLRGNSATGIIVPNTVNYTVSIKDEGHPVYASVPKFYDDGSYEYMRPTYTGNSVQFNVGLDKFSIKIVDEVTGFTRIETIRVNVIEDSKKQIFTDSTFQVTSSSLNQQLLPRIGVLPGSNLLEVWRSYDSSHPDVTDSLRAKIIDTDGNTIVTEFQVNNKDALGMRTLGHDVVTFPDGSFMIFWSTTSSQYITSDYRQGSIFGQKHDSNGNIQGNAFLVSPIPSQNGIGSFQPKATLMSNGNVAICWIDTLYSKVRNHITAQIIDQNGNKIGGIFGWQIDGLHSQHNIKALKGEGVVLIWNTANSGWHYDGTFINNGLGYDVYAMIFDNNGIAKSDKINVNQNTLGDQLQPGIVETEDGGFIIGWYDYKIFGELGSSYSAPATDIRALKFGKNGIKTGDEVVINDLPFFGLDLASLVIDPHTNEDFVESKLNILGIGNDKYLVTWLQGDYQNFAGKLIDSKLNKFSGDTTIRYTSTCNGCNSYLHGVYLGNNKVAITGGKHGIETSIISFGDPIKKGTDGNDFLQDGIGNATFIGDHGSDVLDGGPGIDTASYANSPAGLTLDLSNLTMFNGRMFATGHGGYAEVDRLINIEGIIGSDYDDNLKGDSNNNIIDAGNGNNIADGKGGNDILTSGIGDTIFVGGPGNDAIAGGAGFNVAVFSGKSSGYRIVKDDKVITVTDIYAVDGDDGKDILTGISQLNFVDRNCTLNDFPKITNGMISIPQNSNASGFLGEASGDVYILNTGPVYGNVTFSNNSYTYQPSNKFNGTDSFVYVVTNNKGLGKLVSINIGYNNITNNNSMIVGTTGPDSLVGTNKSEIFDGLTGSNTYTTGGGADVIKISVNPNATDMVSDLSAFDHVDLSDYDFMMEDYTYIRAHINQVDNNTVISFENGHNIILKNFNITNLSTSYFIGNASNNITTPLTAAPTAVSTSAPMNVTTAETAKNSTSVPMNVTRAELAHNVTSAPMNVTTAETAKNSTSVPMNVTTAEPAHNVTSAPMNVTRAEPAHNVTSAPMNVTRAEPAHVTKSVTKSIPVSESADEPTNAQSAEDVVVEISLGVVGSLVGLVVVGVFIYKFKPIISACRDLYKEAFSSNSETDTSSDQTGQEAFSSNSETDTPDQGSSAPNPFEAQQKISGDDSLVVNSFGCCFFNFFRFSGGSSALSGEGSEKVVEA